MNRKHSRDDKIPLTVTKSSILQETRERFDTLLKAALSQEDKVEKTNGKRGRKSSLKGDFLKDVKPHKRRSKKKLSTSTQKLVTEDDDSTSSEQDEPDRQKETSFNTSLEEVKDFTPVSSSDELPKTDKPEAGDLSKTKVLIHSNNRLTDVVNTSPKKLETISYTRPSRRDESRESRETTSSRVSSPDSVMTAIEAASASPSKTIPHSSPEIDHDKSNNDVEEYELKPLKGLSASYEEIDETSLDDDRYNKNTAKGMENAASYEEILEDSRTRLEKNETDSNIDQSQESDHHNRNKKIKKSKLQISLQKFRARDNENTDTSSNERVPIDKRHQKRHASQTRKRSRSAVNKNHRSHSVVPYNYEKIIGITIHRCDTLKIDSLIQHPMVRVHILDTKSGEYLKKSQSSRNVSFFQENPIIDYIQPLTCQPCNFQDPRSLTPIWEETLLFNEDIKHILQPQSSILILFEILDCVSMDTAIAQYKKLGSESGWHRIAWAFLKPCGPNDILNIDKKLRLQLYKPRSEKTLRSNQNVCDKCDVYRWWSKGGWIHYPSTLHVTVHSLPIPSDVTPALRSYFALQPEQFSVSPNDSDDDNDNASNKHRIASSRINSTKSLKDEVVWSRLPLQSCKVPNEKVLDLSGGLNGSFSMKYSHHGLYLATTATNPNIHSIHIYRILEGSEIVRFQGHPALIYSLDWSLNDELLLSASADCTACIWSVKSRKTSPLQMLPHPSFVYCAVFLTTKPLSLATGCCDQIIRIWRENAVSASFELKQEMNGHEGYVSTLCVNSNGNLFSGDSNGQIRIWQYNNEGCLSEIRVLNVRELKGVVLSHLILHPGGKRLLVLARDSLLRMIDIGTGVAIQWFKGALNHRIHSKACITPCGGLVFSPSEDGTFYVWNADTGQLMASYSGIFQAAHHGSSYGSSSHKPESSTLILSGVVDYHPFDHMAAFSVYGIHAPVVMCKYKRESCGKDIGLQGQREVEKPVAVDAFAKSAQIVSHVKKAQVKLKGASNKDYPSGGTSIFASSPECEDEGLRKNQHLSYIIKQLDYVLHLGRLSKQEQLDLVPLQPAAAHSPSISLDSSLQVGSSPTATSTHKEKISLHNRKIEEGDSDVAYSVPHSNVTERRQEGSPMTLSKEEKLVTDKVHFTSPVELQYVQEKQPPRPMPRQRKLKNLRPNGRQLALADLSTTDTSILSSENEDTIKTNIKPVSAQLFSVNEIKDTQSLNSKPEPIPRVQVVNQNPAFLSFDSDSDAHIVNQ